MCVPDYKPGRLSTYFEKKMPPLDQSSAGSIDYSQLCNSISLLTVIPPNKTGADRKPLKRVFDRYLFCSNLTNVNKVMVQQSCQILWNKNDPAQLKWGALKSLQSRRWFRILKHKVHSIRLTFGCLKFLNVWIFKHSKILRDLCVL